MVVVAITSILVLIALPAYLDYMTRSKVAEGLVFMTEARTSVSEQYTTNNSMPTSNSRAGLPPPSSYHELDYISHLEVGADPRAGVITGTFKLPQLGSNNRLQLVPSTAGGQLTWTCQPAQINGIETDKIPANCRS